MAKKASGSNVVSIGRWSFVIGLVIAILSGLPGFPQPKLIMIILGIVVGFININAIETGPFLIAVVALMLSVANLNLNPSGAVGIILQNVLLFLSPASVIVSLKAIYVLLIRNVFNVRNILIF